MWTEDICCSHRKKTTTNSSWTDAGKKTQGPADEIRDKETENRKTRTDFGEWKESRKTKKAPKRGFRRTGRLSGNHARGREIRIMGREKVMAVLVGKTLDYNHGRRPDAFGHVSEFGFFCYMPQEEHSELLRAGIDPEKMGYLSGKERRRILERAGLNPKDYDF
jgi:hypothetical protein